MNDDYDSAGYSDWITDLGFFMVSTVACTAFGFAVYLVLL